MFVESDVIFSAPSSHKVGIIGGKNITTTFFKGKRFDKGSKERTVHVIVSRSKETALKAKKMWMAIDFFEKYKEPIIKKLKTCENIFYERKNNLDLE